MVLKGQVLKGQCKYLVNSINRQCIERSTQVLPSGQLQTLWVVPTFSVRGPHKDHAQPFAVDNSLTEWHTKVPPYKLSLSVQPHSQQPD